VQKLVHCCNWLLTETQCKIISVQHVRRPKTFKNLCLSLVSGVPHFFLRTTPLHPLSSMRTPIAHLLSYTALLQTVSLELTRLETIVHNFPDVNRFSTSFISRLSGKFATKLYINIATRFNYVAHSHNRNHVSCTTKPARPFRSVSLIS